MNNLTLSSQTEMKRSHYQKKKKKKKKQGKTNPIHPTYQESKTKTPNKQLEQTTEIKVTRIPKRNKKNTQIRFKNIRENSIHI
jgi:hypothetical protein